MAFYVKAKSKDKAEEMLKLLLDKYGKEIDAYDLERERYIVTNIPEHLEVEVRTVSRRGGSLTITLSSAVSRYLNIKPGDFVAVILDKTFGRVYIRKIMGFEVS